MTATQATTQATVERQARPTPTTRPAETAEPIVEHELRRFPLGVVGKWSMTLALTTVVAWWAAIAVMWLAAETFGLTRDIESLAREVGFEGFQLASGPVFLALALLGVAWVVSVSLVLVFAAAVYNLYASVLGGIRVESVERTVHQSVPVAPPPAASTPAPTLHD
jgi:hypothetical protein